jgi:hypothetical protein
MIRRPPRIDRSYMTHKSSMAAARVADAMKLARDLEADAEKQRRLKALECKACFYFSRIGGAAITEQPCAACAKPQVYANTNTDILCRECASEHKLCKHCGGDIDMRERRRLWPDFNSEDQPKEGSQ